MTNFAKDWEQAKKAFKAQVVGELRNGGAGVPDDYKTALVAYLKADTGMTPALKDVDAAFGKGHRKAAMQALTRLHGVIEKAAMQLQKISLAANSKAAATKDKAAVNALGEIHMAGFEFKKKLTGFETAVAKKLEALQQAKSPTNAKIDIISLEGDMNGALSKFKTDAKKYPELEKKFKTLNAAKPAEKAMQAYSKAAARTKVSDALAALDDFFQCVDDLTSHRNAIAKDKSKPDQKYVDAVTSLCDALKTIKSQRGAVSHKNLKALQASGS